MGPCQVIPAGQRFARQTESEAEQENSSSAASVFTKTMKRTTVLMVVMMFNSIKMLPSPHRPPFLDVVEDADDEDGGGDQEQQHDQQDLCIVLLKSKKFCHFYLQEPFHIELGLDFEPVLAVKLVLAQLAVTFTFTSRPAVDLGI